MINKEALLERLKSCSNFKRSNNRLLKLLNITIEELAELKDELGIKHKIDVNNFNKIEEFKSVKKEIKELSRKTNNEKGTLESTATSNFEPKTDLELAKLHKVDLTKYVIVNYWTKMLPNGNFTSSLFCKVKTEELIIKEDYVKDIERLFSKTEKFKTNFKNTNSEKALFVYIADDHAGIDFKNSLFEVEYTGAVYYKRLEEVFKQISLLDIKVDTIYIVNLGDELDGFNKQTTRGGHQLDSLSNKEQFDIYTTARKNFYDSLLNLNIFKNFNIININNSNHSGNGYSYMVNKAIEFYLTARYNNITITNQDNFISSYVWGNHTILLTHGKDEKYMKFGFPLNLNEKVDLWLLDYSKNLKAKYISTIKGDLHAYSVNIGKSGRYVNVPSICGGSNWIEHNYGSSNSGVLLEIVDKLDKNIVSIPIWF